MRAGSGQFDVFQIEIFSPAAPKVRVAAIRGKEALSHLFRYDVEVVSHSDAATLRACLALEAHLVIRGADGVREVRGTVSSVKILGRRSVDYETSAVLQLVPLMHRLRSRRQSRVFQDLSVRDIAAEVLTEHGLAYRFSSSLGSVHREYCVQYDESDFNFLSRLLAEEGISYYFENAALEEGWTPGGGSQPSQVVVFGYGDDSPPADGATGTEGARISLSRSGHFDMKLSTWVHSTVRFQDADGMVPDEGVVFEIASLDTIGPTIATIRDDDYRRPLARLERSASAPEAPRQPDGAPLEIFQHRASAGHQNQALRARIALETRRRQTARIFGRSTCALFGAGQWFGLTEHSDLQMCGPHRLIEVNVRGLVPELSKKAVGQVLENRFVAVPAGHAIRPKPHKRRIQQVVEFATVVGPDGQEIYTDHLGRVKVQFHWDRYGHKNERSSLWMRVSHPWAGAGYGMHFVPRIGTEVSVSFVDGNVDFPFITGCLHNPVLPPPFTPASNPTKGGLQTRSTGGGSGGSCLEFDDAAGAEYILLRSQKDLNAESREQMTHSAGTDYVLSANGTVDETSGSRRQRIAGPLAMAAATRSEYIHMYDQCVVAGSRSVDIGGALTVHCGSYELAARDRLAVSAPGGVAIAVGTAEAEADAFFGVSGTFRVDASHETRIASGERIVLECGETSLTLEPERAVLRTKRLVLDASETLTGFGEKAALRLGTAFELLADDIAVVTEDSSVEVSKDEIRLSSPQVLVSATSGTDVTIDREEAEVESKQFAWKFYDAFGEPLANKTYRLKADGVRAGGMTDADGGISLELPARVQTAVVQIWSDRFPVGPRNEFVVATQDPDDASTILGAKQRLASLGMYRGPMDEQESQEYAFALREFQRTRGLAPSGTLNTDTAQGLEKSAAT